MDVDVNVGEARRLSSRTAFLRAFSSFLARFRSRFSSFLRRRRSFSPVDEDDDEELERDRDLPMCSKVLKMLLFNGHFKTVHDSRTRGNTTFYLE
jgi:hypothetical protein